MTAPLPPYQPSSPAWQAGYEHAKRQAAEVAASEPEPEGNPPPELAQKPTRVIAVASVRATKRNIAARILAMRPSPPRVSPGMEPTPYSAPTTLHARVAAQDSGSGADALCGQLRAVEAAFLSYIQEDNGCEQTSTPCRAPKQCGCAVEMDVAVTMRGNEGVVG